MIKRLLIKIKASALLFILLVSFSAHSIELFEQEISSIGAHTGQTMYFLLKSDALKTNQCKFEVMYCPSTNNDCKAMLSIALAAKTTKSKVYIAFNKEADNTCNLWNIRF